MIWVGSTSTVFSLLDTSELDIYSLSQIFFQRQIFFLPRPHLLGGDDPQRRPHRVLAKVHAGRARAVAFEQNLPQRAVAQQIAREEKDGACQ